MADAFTARHSRIVRPLRVLVIACLAASLVACTDTGTPTSPTLVTPNPTPTAEVTASPTSASTLEPAATCPSDPSAVEAQLDLGTISGVVTIPLESGTTVPAPSASISPIDPAEVPIEATVVGGVEIRGDLVLDPGDLPGTVITALTARFIPFDASPAAPVQVALDGAGIVLTLPDENADGRLWVAIDWNTSCGAGAGGGSVGLTIVNSSIVAGCPTTGDGIQDALVALNERTVTVGTLDVPFGVVAGNARWFSAFVDSIVPEFAGWDRDSSVLAAPDSSILVREAIDDLVAKSIRTSIYRRGDVIDFLSPDSTGELRSVAVLTRSPGPKGNVGITAPDEPGNYVFSMTGQWQTSCINVETYMAVSVEVR